MSTASGHSWQSVQDEVLRRINERIWRPGDLIPSEVELALEFGCARATVNRALRELADAGLLDRRRKAGTRIALNPVRKATLDIPITRLDIERRGSTYGYHLIGLERCPPPVPVRSRLALDENADTMHVRALHLADGQPHVLEDRWIHLEAVPDILEVDLAAVSANEWLVRNAPFTKGDIAFSARKADPDDAEHLGAPVGEALFVVERTTWNGPLAITWVRLAHAPGFRLRTTI